MKRLLSVFLAAIIAVSCISFVSAEEFDFDIIKQPTVADPTFEVTPEDKFTFQWYEVQSVTHIIDDTMTDYCDGVYDPETQLWIGSPSKPNEYDDFTEYTLDLFELHLEKDQCVKITLTNPNAVSPVDPDIRFVDYQNDCFNVAEYDENGVAFFTAEASGLYTIYQYALYPETTEFRFEFSEEQSEPLPNETQKTLSSFELGNTYYVIATDANGNTLVSDRLLMEYAITKQPTPDNPSVKVTFEDDIASCQWHSTVIGDRIVTDIMATPGYYEGESEGERAIFDEESGSWIPSLYAKSTDGGGKIYYEYDLFEISLKEGETILIIPSAELRGDIIYTFSDNMNSLDTKNAWTVEDGAHYFTAPQTDSYYFYLQTYVEDITFRAYLCGDEIIGDAVENETSNKLSAKEAGDYVCIITYKDGTQLISDVVTLAESGNSTLGDVNSDGAINQYDYILVKRHYFGTRYLTDDELARADANKDGAVNQYDYILIKRHYFGTYVIG
ncbi:MAG: hypothetical protein E7595_06950 [Ruminococcaceae bacterium]|nr:hypothetical protein [Oscillospiraceae bacterium]